MVKNNTISVWKPQGWTPLKAIEEFKKKNPKFVKKISYAGRLDPMAEGVLLLLVGDENKRRKEYEKLPKTYEAEIILGISTDSFDALGIIYSIEPQNIPTEANIKKCLKKFKGRQQQKYPPYSSKTVNGKSLIWWTKNNRLREIIIPEKEIEIYSLEFLGMSKIEATSLCENVKARLDNVEGNFRQDEILKAWEILAAKYSEEKFLKIKINVSCSSGTYIRRLADDIGKRLGTGAFALSIVRTSVGKYNSVVSR